MCGSGFNARRSGKVCALHTTRVSPETLLAYWGQLPPDHQTALFTLPRHDFEAELDSCCRCAQPPAAASFGKALLNNVGFSAFYISDHITRFCVLTICS